ncbi:MAG: class I SAM-dependent methyltransferase, partial [Promethearchaeota archaeon]
MFDSVKKWISEDGPKFISDLGIKEGNVVVDFGCNEGHYTFPIARIVGKSGLVYAVDKSEYVLDNLIKDAAKIKIDKLQNIKTINTNGGLKLPQIKDNSVDFVLTFDILHYLHKNERLELYKEVHRVLKPEGIYLVYPKHISEDWPLMNFADLSVDDVIEEIERIGFKNIFQKQMDLFHDDDFDHGYVLKF